MRAGRRFGMILHTEQRQVAMPQAFQSLVVQVDVRQLDFTVGQRIRVDGKIMVVRRDLNLARLQLLDRMIPAMMPELQLESFSAQCNASELMSQTDSEDRLQNFQAEIRASWRESSGQ